MLDNNLPWQIDALIIDALLSMAVSMYMLSRRMTRFSPTARWLYPLWPLACVLLIATGGSLTWQHFLILTLEVWALAKSVIRIREGGWIGNEQVRRSVATKGLTGGAGAAGVLITVATVWLLVAGVSS